MRYSNYHTHCYFCDGNGTPQQYLELALDKDLHYLGFSSHAPLPFDTDWTMDDERLKKYLYAIRELKGRNTKTDILLGLEIDHIKGIVSPADKKWHVLGLDYIIGSVHFPGLFGDEIEYYTVDGSQETFDKLINEHFGGSGRKLVERYYRCVMEMVLAGGFDFIGHFDLVKKNNAGGRYFDQDSSWYKDAAHEVLEMIADKDLMLEINTGGMSRGFMQEPYPSVEILKTCKRLGIKLILNSDAHQPDDITYGFDQMIDIVRSTGYREIYDIYRKPLII